MANTTTPFSSIYNSFLAKTTDDMYMQFTREDTQKLLKQLLLNALHWFEFPRFDLWNFDEEAECYNVALTKEEINILSTYMVVEWIGQQLASIENTRMKYSGSDFKFTSQANHMSKLQSMRKQYERMGFHLQRLYKRRVVSLGGRMVSTLDIIMAPMDFPTWKDTTVPSKPQSSTTDNSEILSSIAAIKDKLDILTGDKDTPGSIRNQIANTDCQCCDAIEQDSVKDILV